MVCVYHKLLPIAHCTPFGRRSARSFKPGARRISFLKLNPPKDPIWSGCEIYPVGLSPEIGIAGAARIPLSVFLYNISIQIITEKEKEYLIVAISKSGSLRTFVILTYLLFWVLFSVTGLTVYLKAPEIVQTVMQNVCAWTSTFVLIIWFKKFYPNETIKGYLKKQFRKTTVKNFAIPTLIQILLFTLATIIFYSINGEPFKNITFIKTAAILPMVLIFITSGPMGEELGWRGYALNEFQKKYNPLISSLYIGLLWGFWHFPLWLITGLTGYDLVFYSASFMLGIISFSVFVTYFYNKKRKIYLLQYGSIFCLTCCCKSSLLRITNLFLLSH